jgi:hypothetical protein
MPIDWKTQYQTAIRELDPRQKPALCERARHAIHERLLEQGRQHPDATEREELEEALRQLTLHKYKKSPRPN